MSGSFTTRERSDRDYCLDLAKSKILTPSEEESLADQIHLARQALWFAFLRYPRFVDPICSLLEASYSEFPRSLTKEMRDAAASPSAKAKYAAACEKFVKLAADADRDEIVVSKVLHDLRARRLGGEADLPLGQIPRLHKRVFHDYCDRIEQAAAHMHALITRFTEANLRLVVTISRRFAWSKLSLQDLVQEGNLGLIKAIRRFDHTRKLRFSTFATWWIRHAVTRGIADKDRQIRLPVHHNDLIYKIKKYRVQFESTNGRYPTPEETCKHLEISRERYDNAVLTITGVGMVVSLSSPVSDDESSTIGDFLEDKEINLEAASREGELQDILSTTMGCLSDIERDVINKRFALQSDDGELTLKEIGEQYQLSRERIRQIEQSALQKMRKRLHNVGFALSDV